VSTAQQAGARDSIGIAMLRYGYMGKVHSFAFQSVRFLRDLDIQLVSISGRDSVALEKARGQYGWAESTEDWRDQVADDRINVFDNGGPNFTHAEPTLAAIEQGKHVFCEKPLSVTAEEAFGMWTAAHQAEVTHMCGFNYRFMPAVRLARDMLKAGDLGEVTHFGARFLSSPALVSHPDRTWRFDRAAAGSGALGDLGSHIIDLARFLVGEPTAVSAVTQTFVAERHGKAVDVDDAFAAVLEFEGGALGTLEASRAAGGVSNVCAFEVNGTRGSLAFNVERLNELEVRERAKSRRVVEVTDSSHPFMSVWWPPPSPGHSISWADSFTHEMDSFLAAVQAGQSVAPWGADFGDGYRCAEICDAILRSAASRRREPIEYRVAANAPKGTGSG
jgi:predicted dehydrogenase